MLYNLIDLSMEQLTSTKDVSIIVDGSRFIKDEELRIIGKEIAIKYDKNLRKCRKGLSYQEPCLRIVDYVAGSVWTKYEKENYTYFNILNEKISMARRF